MSTNRHPIGQEELMAYLDGELPPDGASEALSHLELCPECQALAADLRGISQGLMAWEVEVPEAGMSSEIETEFAERFQPREGVKVSWPRLKNALMALSRDRSSRRVSSALSPG